MGNLHIYGTILANPHWTIAMLALMAFAAVLSMASHAMAAMPAAFTPPIPKPAWTGETNPTEDESAKPCQETANPTGIPAVPDPETHGIHSNGNGNDPCEPPLRTPSGKHSPEEQQAILEILRLISDMDPTDAEGEQDAIAGILGAMPRIGNASGQLVLDSLHGIQGEELVGLLRAANRLGAWLDARPGISMLGAATLLAYFSRHADQNAMRGAISLLYAMLPGNDRIKATVCRRLETGKNRIDRGMEELESLGLNLDADIPNAPGAGRPSLDDALAEHLAAYAAVALGMTEQEVRERLAEMNGSHTDDSREQHCETESPASPLPQEPRCDATCEGSPSPAQANDAEPTPPATPLDELQAAFGRLESSAEKAVGKMNNALSNSRYGSTSYLRDWLSYIPGRMDDIREAVGKAMDAGTPAECNVEAGIPAQVDMPNAVSKALERHIAANELTNAINALRIACDDIARAIDSVEPPEDEPTLAYRRLKACSKAVPFKRRKGTVERHWHGYSIAKDTAEKVAAAIAASEKSMLKSEERAENENTFIRPEKEDKKESDKKEKEEQEQKQG